MESQPYSAEIETVLYHFLSAVDGVKINRYRRDNEGNKSIEKVLDVPLKLNVKSRTLHELIQVNGHIKYPVMAVTFTGMQRNLQKNRAKNYSYAVKDINGSGNYVQVYKPTPVTLQVRLDIGTVFEEDFLQIVTNFMAYFNPYIFFSWREPFTGKEIRSKAQWDGNVTKELQGEIDGDTKRKINGSANFTIETYIFRERLPDAVPIRCFDMNWWSLSACNPYVDSERVQKLASLEYCANPCITDIEPECARAGDRVVLKGSNLDHVNNVFFIGSDEVVTELSGCSAIDACSDVPADTQHPYFWDVFGNNECLSGDNPPFIGLPSTSFTIIDENRLEVVIPDDFNAGSIDFRVVTDWAGYADLTNAETVSGCVSPWVAGFTIGSTSVSGN